MVYKGHHFSQCVGLSVSLWKKLKSIFWTGFSKTLSFQIAMYGRAGVWRRPKFTFCLTFFQSYLLPLFSVDCFHFGRGGPVGMSHARETTLLSLL